MTYRELMDEVAALGFDSAVEDTGVLVAATNRAQRQLDRALGGALVHVTLSMAAPGFVCEAPREVAGEWRLPVTDAIALSFESVGQGTLTLTRGEEVRRYALTGSSYRARRYLFPDLRGATVTLRGTVGLCVRALAVFGKASAPSAATTSAAPPRRSLAVTLAPCNFSTPRITAALPRTVTSAPMRLSSAAYL